MWEPRSLTPEFAVECKSGERAIGPWLGYFAERAPIPPFFQVHRGDGSILSPTAMERREFRKLTAAGTAALATPGCRPDPVGT